MKIGVQLLGKEDTSVKELTKGERSSRSQGSSKDIDAEPVPMQLGATSTGKEKREKGRDREREGERVMQEATREWRKHVVPD